jgi:hypothetical protein
MAVGMNSHKLIFHRRYFWLVFYMHSFGAGNSSKALLIVHVRPSASNLSRTLSTLSFSARARNAELSLGNRDTIKKWKDVV